MYTNIFQDPEILGSKAPCDLGAKGVEIGFRVIPSSWILGSDEPGQSCLFNNC